MSRYELLDIEELNEEGYEELVDTFLHEEPDIREAINEHIKYEGNDYCI